MKHISLLALIVFSLLIISCTESATSEEANGATPSFTSVAAEGNIIRYNVYLKPQDLTDPYAYELYEDFDRTAFVDSIFSALYYHQCQITDMYGDPMTAEEMHDLEISDPERFGRDKLACIQFTEQWTFDPAQKQMKKEILSMLIGYEVLQDSMIVALRPGFVISF